MSPSRQKESTDNRRAMQVVDHFRHRIETGSLKPGDKIPPERELAEELGISRASLRAGIGYLAAMGVMKVRHGVGTFVADGPPEIARESIGMVGVLHGFQSWQMFEARLILEGSLAALAAERGKPEHFAALADEVDAVFACLDKPKEYLIHDVLFHRLLSQAAGNPILSALMETVTTSLYGDRRHTVEQAIDLLQSAEMHRKIFTAVKEHKPTEARSLMEEHLRMAQMAHGLEGKLHRKPAVAKSSGKSSAASATKKRSK